jgi:O-antigen/teichoic acid export membrane protein
LLGGLGLLFGLILFFSAPLLVHVILGDAFRGSVAALRVFSLWIPLVALSTALTFQLLLPDQLDYQFNAVVISAGLLGVGSALLLAPSYQAVGIAWSAVIGQLFSLIAFSVTRLG